MERGFDTIDYNRPDRKEKMSKFKNKVIQQSTSEWTKCDSIGRALYDHRYYNSNDLSTRMSNVINTWQNTLWPINGKHKDKKLKELPLQYLGWVIDNFDEDSVGYKLAYQELECRYQNMA